MQPDSPLPEAPLYLAVGMADLPRDDDWLTEPEAVRLQALEFTKRREEARLGRWTAKRALAKALGLGEARTDLRGVVIRNAADGAPEVFRGSQQVGTRISMTDRADWAVCVVSAGDDPIGCDLELIEPRSARFVADYFTPAEREFVASSPGNHDLLSNLIWSAKESALKVLRTGLRRDTRSVEVVLTSDFTDPTWNSLCVTTSEQISFGGWWRRFGEFLLTYVSAVEAGPPSSLVEPSPLHHAVPSHSWMAAPHRQSP